MHARGALILSLFLLSVQAAPPDCSLLNGQSIKLITFDAFDALFDLLTGLQSSLVTEFSTGSGSDTTRDIYDNWLLAYRGKAGTTFDSSSISGFPQPFPFVINTGLQSVLNGRNAEGVPNFASLMNPGGSPPTRTIYDDYPSTSTPYLNVVAAWSKLNPFSDTISALQSLAVANYTLGFLSNGDSPTLLALAALLPGVNITYIFPSDLPPDGSGAFKPNAATYARVLTATGLTSDQVVHVAGGSVDASGARDGGLFSILALHSSDPPGSGTAPCTTFSGANPLASILPFLQQVPSLTPSPTMSPTPTPSDTPTSTPSPTTTPTTGSSQTATPTSPSTVTPSPTSSSTPTPTASRTPSPTRPSSSPLSSSAGLDGGSVAGIVIFVLLMVGAGGVLATSAVARAHAWRLWRKLRAVVLGTGVGGIDITDKRPVALAEEVEFANPVPHKVSASV